jgi:hypothetical protein
MSDLSPLSGEQRKSNFGAARSVDDHPERTFGLVTKFDILIRAKRAMG